MNRVEPFASRGLLSHGYGLKGQGSEIKLKKLKSLQAQVRHMLHFLRWIESCQRDFGAVDNLPAHTLNLSQ